MSSLNNAIQLIREGRKEEARQFLEPLLKADPANIQAWFWYVETCSTLEKRVQVLEICLKMNPGNSQVTQALQTLRSQRPAQRSSTPAPVQSSKPVISQSPQTPLSSSAIYTEERKSPIPTSNTPIYADDRSASRTVVTSSAPQHFSGEEKKAWQEDNASYVDTSLLSKSNPAAKSYAFYDAWLMVLSTMDIESYKSVLNDPEAGAGRAFEWVAYAGLLSGLISPLSLMSNPRFTELMNMPEFRGLFGNMGAPAFIMILALVMAVLTPIFSVIGLAIGAGIQNFLAGLFGGNGNFGRTVYALAAYAVPMTILVAVLGLIPLVGQCLTSLLGLYNIILNVRALRAAHSISIWQALGVIFAPTILIMIFGCVLVFLVGLPGLSS